MAINFGIPSSLDITGPLTINSGQQITATGNRLQVNATNITMLVSDSGNLSALTVTGSNSIGRPNFIGIGNLVLYQSGNSVIVSGGAGVGTVTQAQLDSVSGWAANNLAALSGWTNSSILNISGVLSDNLTLTGGYLYSLITGLTSGVINVSVNNAVFTTGNQNIGSVKTFNSGIFTGWVGIGTTSPQQSLHVTGGIRSDFGYFSGGTNLADIFATQIALLSTGQQAWNAANNNGINLSGRLTATGQSLYGYILGLSGLTATPGINYVYTTGNQNIGSVKTFNSGIFSGAVGINTASPRARLHVVAPVATAIFEGSGDFGMISVVSPTGSGYWGSHSQIPFFANDWSGVQNATFAVFRDYRNTNGMQDRGAYLRIRATSGYQVDYDRYGYDLFLGYNTGRNLAYIQSLRQNVAYTPLSLQPDGGTVGVGIYYALNRLSVGSSNNDGIGFYYDGANNYKNAITNGFNSVTLNQNRMDFSLCNTTTGNTNTILTLLANTGVGIGTTSPSFQLSLGKTLNNTKLGLYDDVNGTVAYGLGIQASQFRFHIDAAASRFSFLNAPNGLEIGTLKGNGFFGLGTSSPSTNLHVTGGVRLQNFPNGVLATDANGNIFTTGVNITGTFNNVVYTTGNQNIGDIKTFNSGIFSGSINVAGTVKFQSLINGVLATDLNGNVFTTGLSITGTISNVLAVTSYTGIIATGTGLYSVYTVPAGMNYYLNEVIVGVVSGQNINMNSGAMFSIVTTDFVQTGIDRVRLEVLTSGTYSKKTMKVEPDINCDIFTQNKTVAIHIVSGALGSGSPQVFTLNFYLNGYTTAQ